jgi:hypothetical protein
VYIYIFVEEGKTVLVGFPFSDNHLFGNRKNNGDKTRNRLVGFRAICVYVRMLVLNVTWWGLNWAENMTKNMCVVRNVHKECGIGIDNNAKILGSTFVPHGKNLNFSWNTVPKIKKIVFWLFVGLNQTKNDEELKNCSKLILGSTFVPHRIHLSFSC